MLWEGSVQSTPLPLPTGTCRVSALVHTASITPLGGERTENNLTPTLMGFSTCITASFGVNRFPAQPEQEIDTGSLQQKWETTPSTFRGRGRGGMHSRKGISPAFLTIRIIRGICYTCKLHGLLTSQVSEFWGDNPGK